MDAELFSLLGGASRQGLVSERQLAASALALGGVEQRARHGLAGKAQPRLTWHHAHVVLRGNLEAGITRRGFDAGALRRKPGCEARRLELQLHTALASLADQERSELGRLDRQVTFSPLRA